MTDLDKAVDSYVTLIMKISAAFLQSLALADARLVNSNVEVIASDCKNIKSSLVGLPVLNMQMLDYVLTQILPLSTVLKFNLASKQYSTVFDTKLKQSFVKRFNDMIIDKKLLKDCFPPTTKTSDFIDSFAAEKLLQTRERIYGYLEAQDNLQTYEQYLGCLKALKVHNDLHLTNLDFTLPFMEFTKLGIWLLTAFADWFGVDVVDPNDVKGMLNIMLSYELLDASMIYTEAYNANDTKLLHRINEAMEAAGLYMTQTALYKLAGIYNFMGQNPRLMKSILSFGEYMYNIRGPKLA